MSNVEAKITVKELETYLESLENEKTNETSKQINKYRQNCEDNQKNFNVQEIRKIGKTIDSDYKRWKQTKDKILELLKECKEIPGKIQKLQITEYMLYRVDMKSAERIIQKSIIKLQNKYNEVTNEILQYSKQLPKYSQINEINFDKYKANENILNTVKHNYKEEYTDEERKALIQKELDILEKAKIFNNHPIPHEILKSFDKETQAKLPKFNNIRKRNLRIIANIENDYMKLAEPRELETIIDDAISNLESVSKIIKKTEYDIIKSKLNRRKRSVIRSTSEIRSIINYREKKTGIVNFNIQNARYERIGDLRNKILEAEETIKKYDISGLNEQLEKLNYTYQREKYYALIIENFDETEDDPNAEIKECEERIKGLKKRIEYSKETISTQEDAIKSAKEEMLKLWNIEIESTISKKKEVLEIAELNKDTKTKEKKFNLRRIFEIKNISNQKRVSI